MRILAALTTMAAAAMASSASAQSFDTEQLSGLEVVGKPIDGGMDFQFAATELARDIHWLDGLLLIVITIISLFVSALIVWCVVYFRESKNKTSASFTHNTKIEIAWTVIPIVILVFIGVASLPILFKQQEIPEADITIKVTGYQWYWGYEYVDEGFGFESIMLQKDELADYGYADDEYLLATDTSVVVPVGATVVMQVTGADVIHSWTIPAFGVKQDGVPGRIAELWFAAEREGVYFGQCSELCGKDHAYMPITVKVVSQEVYDQWLMGAKDEFASLPATNVPYQVASK